MNTTFVLKRLPKHIGPLVLTAMLGLGACTESTNKDQVKFTDTEFRVQLVAGEEDSNITGKIEINELIAEDKRSEYTFRILGWAENVENLIQNPVDGVDPISGEFNLRLFPNASGKTHFSWVLINSKGESSKPSRVEFEIAPVNDVPVALAKSVQIDEDSGTTNIQLQASDIDGPEQFFYLSSPPTKGTAVINRETGILQYAPAANQTGTDAFQFEVSDGSGSSPATITIQITPQNDMPLAGNFSLSLMEDPTGGFVSGTYQISDPDQGDSHTIIIASNPRYGVLSADPSDARKFRYQPNANYSGSDQFSYRVRDSGQLLSDLGTVSITVTPVNDPPVPQNTFVNMQEDAAYSGRLAAIDVDSANLTFVIIQQPSFGSAQVTNPSAGNFTFTPRPNSYGQDLLKFSVSDGQTTVSTGVVTFNIGELNDPPVAQNMSVSMYEDENLAQRAFSVSDPDLLDSLYVEVVSQPLFGTLTLQIPPAYNANYFGYRPNANYSGTDSFTYKVRDGRGVYSATQTVSITISPRNDAPVVPNYTSVSGTEDQAQLITLPATDIDSPSLTFSIVTRPTRGTLDKVSEGVYRYTPNANFSGQDSFTYYAYDGAAYSPTVPFAINIAAVNDAPVASNSSLVLGEDPDSGYVAANLSASDPDGETPTVEIISLPSKGSLGWESPLRYRYYPRANLNGTDSFSYRVRDSFGLFSAIVTVSLTINAVNDPPVYLGATVFTGNEDTDFYIDLRAGDIDSNLHATMPFDVFSSVQSLASIRSAAYPVCTVESGYVQVCTQRFLVDLMYNANGTQAFSVTSTDSQSGRGWATIYLQIAAVNDPPAGINQTLNIYGWENFEGQLQAADDNFTADQLIYSITQQPATGRLTLNGRNFKFEPGNPSANYSTSFSFSVREPNGGLSNYQASQISLIVRALRSGEMKPLSSLELQRRFNLILDDE